VEEGEEKGHKGRSAWSVVGSATSLNNSVGKMFTFNNILYVAGYFSSAGGGHLIQHILPHGMDLHGPQSDFISMRMLDR